MNKLNNHETNRANSKAEAWRQKIAELAGITDKLGLGIDDGIKEAVAALQLLGMTTVGSHEGKIDRYPVPYIDVESSRVPELEETLAKASTEQEREAIFNEILRANLDERRKIIPHLEAFYQNRNVPYMVRLGIQSLGRGWSRIQSQGADFQEVETDEKVRAETLRQFQEEMRAFTDFLKDKFFAE